jgi:hypothetical protein
MIPSEIERQSSFPDQEHEGMSLPMRLDSLQNGKRNVCYAICVTQSAVRNHSGTASGVQGLAEKKGLFRQIKNNVPLLQLVFLAETTASPGP